MHHPLRHPPHPSFTPFLLSAFLLFSRCHFPCSWQADINTAISKTFNEKQTPWHSPSHTGIPTHAKVSQNRTPACTTLSQTYPPHPSFTPFLLSAFLLFSRCHFPCSWQADINRAASKTFNEKQTPWHSPSHTGIPTHAPTRYPKTGLQHAPHSQTSPPTFLHHPPYRLPTRSSQRAPPSYTLGKQIPTQPFQKLSG